MLTISEGLAIGIQHHQAGRLHAAEQVYRQILALQPNHGDAWHLLGVIAHQVGKHEIAVQYIQRAIGLNGGAATFHLNLGGAYRALHRTPDAVACYRRAVELKPDFAEAHNNLGNALRDQGKLDEAVACYRRTLELRPGFAEVYCNLGAALKDQGKLDETVASYRRALELKPDYAEPYNNLGNALKEQGNLDEAVACYRRAVELKPDFAMAHHNLGVAVKEQGKPDETIACYRRALELKPDYAVAHYNLGIALKEQGNLDEAIDCYGRALELKPDFPEAYNNLGNVLKAKGKLDEAVACYHQALQQKPDFAEGHNNLGNVLKDQGKLDETIACYRQALQLKPDFTEAHNNLGNALRDQGKLDQTIACYRRALELKPDYADVHFNLAHAYRDLGRFDEAKREYSAVLKLKPGDVKTYYSLFLIHHFTPADQSMLDEIEAAAARRDLSLFERRQLHFALGKAYDDLGQYDRAFSHFHEANELARPEFDRPRLLRLVERMEAWFPQPRFAAGGDSGNPSQLPIFIVGMPRSGTTLVEQIIASHPQVYGFGELVETETMANELWGDRLAEPVAPPPPSRLEPHWLAKMAEAYLQRRRAVSGNASRITSKMPTNFFYLGLIALLFPKARVIHCRRDPRDTCLSCFFTDFKQSPPYHYRFADLCFYYRLYLRMMDHWRAVLPLSTLEVQYEELVENPEELSRRMIDFCGLEWDDRCLRYYENRRPVQTLSVWQVRQPIYTTSVDRWKHYLPHIQPLLRDLAAEAGTEALGGPSPAWSLRPPTRPPTRFTPSRRQPE
jgi:tetratricopeptide (TPR) repeat protein